jgi:hypothetical protein
VHTATEIARAKYDGGVDMTFAGGYEDIRSGAEWKS